LKGMSRNCPYSLACGTLYTIVYDVLGFGSAKMQHNGL
jgi:hypothetical protein